MNTRDLEAFLAVVETGSIVAASALLNLTQPGVTRRVQSLEDRLGSELLDRQSKPLKPTAAGRQAYELGRSVLRSVQDLVDTFTDHADIGGEFRFGVTPFLAETTLAGPVDALRAIYPRLTLRISTTWSSELVDLVHERALDAAIIFMPGDRRPANSLEYELLGHEKALVVAASKLGLPDQVSLQDISRFPWVLNQEGCGLRQVVRSQLEAARLPFTVGIEAFGLELQLSLVRRGLGIGLITQRQLSCNPLLDTLRAFTVEGLNADMCAWLVYRPPAGRLAAPIALFKGKLSEALNNNSGP